MVRLLLVLLGLATLPVCGGTGGSKPQAPIAALVRVRTVSEVRRVFARHGIRLDSPADVSGISEPASYLTGMTVSAASLRMRAPYAAARVPVGVAVSVYPTVRAARAGSRVVYTVGNAGPVHVARARNVVVDWSGRGRARGLEAVLRDLR